MIRIITDSASDILPAEAELLGVQVIPLNVTFEDGTVVRDGLDMTPQEYYTRLPQCGKLPTTSQPSPELFEAAYRDAIAAGDTVIGLFLSSQLSGTFQSARMAVDMAEASEQQVHLIDTETVCLAEALLVRLAVRLRDEGKSVEEILAAVEHAKQHLHLVAVVDDLTYLRKGGRLPAAVAIAGGMLGIKPLITVKEGKVAMAGKARGLPGAYVALFKQIDALGGIAPGSEAVAAYTSSAREVEPIETYFTNNLHREAPLARRIGCVIGTHTGPGAFGFAFFDAALDPALCAAGSVPGSVQ
jgi:DegV family protein with EDD domain